MGSKNCWMKWLPEACRMTPVHKPAGFQAAAIVKTKQRPIMLAETMAKLIQPVPAL